MASIPQVLIVGAGPVGLTAALALAQKQVQVKIVDALQVGRNGSRAAIIHANTLEHLDSIGCADDLLPKGVVGKGPSVYFGAEQTLKYDFEKSLTGKTKYPMMFHISQHQFEAYLEKKLEQLGVQVQRGMRITSLNPKDTELEVIFDDGSKLFTQYLVGADGSRSTVRELCNVSFTDPANGKAYHESSGTTTNNDPAYVVLSDIHFEEPLPPCFAKDQVAGIICNEIILTLIPLHDSQGIHSNNDTSKPTSFWRIGITTDPTKEPPPINPFKEYLQDILGAENPSKLNGPPIRIHSVESASRYRVREAIASTFYKKMGGGHVFLAGDAAHVHSPMGGQGMNLGICDAIALSQTLIPYLTSPETITTAQDSETAFKQYSEKRRGIARQVISLAGGLNGFFGIVSRPWVKLFAKWIIGGVYDRVDYLKDIVIWRVSGLIYRDQGQYSSV